MKNNDITKILLRLKNESAPQPDVTDQVMNIINQKQFRFVNETSRPLMLVAMTSSALAACLAVLAIILIKVGQQQPLVDILEQIEWVM